VSKSNISQHLAGLAPDDQATLSLIERLGQHHLVENWPEPGQETSDKQRLLSQFRALDARYPGGIERYLQNAERLLEESRCGNTPYTGYVPHVPEGTRVAFASAAFFELEELGLVEANRCGFVLVAGGLGERLGFPGIKVALPAESATERSFLAVYASHILALQQRSNECLGEVRQLPLAIMTSGDTYAGTIGLLKANGNFGLATEQVTILRQETVAGIADPTPRLAISPSDPYQIVTKPHGHGDVHVLLHQTGLARRWLEQGLRWLLFFQDTNALSFHAALPALAVSARDGLELNSVVVPRFPGEAAGGLVRLVKPDSELTVNVEYNLLDSLLRAAPGGDGDVPDHTGYSPYPANINVIVMALPPYVGNLERTGGAVPEFVNPKYADGTLTSFKSAARLECMMQDYPRMVASLRVGFTQLERSVCFSPVKNSLDVAAVRQVQQPPLPVECASTGEADLYALTDAFFGLQAPESKKVRSRSITGFKSRSSQ
jgi:UDP-sugar pyrophosphorylase